MGEGRSIIERRVLSNMSMSTAYLFLMITLLFGLPLLTAYYGVNPSFFFAALIPYLAFSAIGTMFIIRQSRRNNSFPREAEASERALKALYLDSSRNNSKPNFIANLNSKITTFWILALATSTVIVYSLMRLLIWASSPYPAPSEINYLGWFYIVLLAITSVLGFSRLLYTAFPVLRSVLRNRRYAFLAGLFSLSFAIVYSLVVNGILIVGVNTTATAPPPSNSYPYVYPPMTPATPDPIVNLVYLPTIVIQLSYQLNFIMIPFEVVFTALLSLLVGSNIAMAHYLISSNGLKCSTKGAALSTSGSIIGLTATCPTCLVPAFVSALFGAVGIGGAGAIQNMYSNIYGVALPPLLSVATLFLSLVYLSRAVMKNASTS
jgi:hypothetical protein